MYNRFYLLKINVGQKILKIVELCNQNEGFLSVILTISALVLSLIAITISILTFKGQVQTQLFERRADVYRKLREIYNVCNCLVEKKDTKFPYHLTMKLIVRDLFLYNTKEFSAAHRLVYLKPILDASDLKKDDDVKLIEEWSDKFFEITEYEISLKRELEDLKIQIHLLYSDKVEETIIELLDKYQEFRWDIFEIDEKLLRKRFEDLNKALNKVKEKNIFDRLDKETTSNFLKKS